MTYPVGHFNSWHPEIVGWSDDILSWYADWADKMAAAILSGARPSCTVVEIGAYHGRSILFLADRLRDLGVLDSCSLSVVDDFGKDYSSTARATFEGNREGMGLNTIVELHAMPSLIAADRTTVLFYGPIDLVFIDADHAYEAVRDDVAAWRARVTPGGTIAGHDYTHDGPHAGVGRAVDEAFGRDKIKVFGSVWSVEV